MRDWEDDGSKTARHEIVPPPSKFCGVSHTSPLGKLQTNQALGPKDPNQFQCPSERDEARLRWAFAQALQSTGFADQDVHWLATQLTRTRHRVGDGLDRHQSEYRRALIHRLTKVPFGIHAVRGQNKAARVVRENGQGRGHRRPKIGGISACRSNGTESRQPPAFPKWPDRPPPRSPPSDLPVDVQDHCSRPRPTRPRCLQFRLRNGLGRVRSQPWPHRRIVGLGVHRPPGAPRSKPKIEAPKPRAFAVVHSSTGCVTKHQHRSSNPPAFRMVTLIMGRPGTTGSTSRMRWLPLSKTKMR